MAQKNTRARWRTNHWISIGLVLVIFGAAQFLNFKYFHRANLSPLDYTKLSELSLNVIRDLPGTVTLTSFIAPQGDPLAPLIQGDLLELLDQYRYNSNGKIEVRRVDPFINFDDARSLVDQFKLTTNENVVIVEYADRSKVLRLADLAEVDASGEMFGSPPRLVSFKAEREITSAIQQLVRGNTKKIYFTSGHGEFNPLAPDNERLSYSLIGSYLRRQNAELFQINLAEKGGVPPDADLVVVAGPRSRFTQGEIDLLRSYFLGEKPGKLLVLLDPETTTGLEDFFASYGLTFSADLAVTKISMLGQTRLLADAIGTSFAVHPAIDWARKLGTNLVLGACRSLAIGSPVEGEAAKVTPLVRTPESYWGETDPNRESVQFDEGKDIRGPLTLAAAVEVGAVDGLDVHVSTPKAIAVGGAAFLINENLGNMQVDFAVNAVNWLLGQEDALGIAPKEPKEFKTSLLPEQQEKITLLILLVVPGAIAVIGLAVWWRRRI
ncbi:MAG: Gldg family protein [Candidatus Methylacidiphilales bacterium]